MQICNTVLWIRLLLCLSILIGSSVFFSFQHYPESKLPHPIHLSVCELKYNPRSQNIEASLKVFTDDLQESLAQLYKINTHFDSPKYHPETPKYLAQFLNDMLLIQLNDKKAALQYFGHETETDAQWIHFQISCPNRLQKVGITNKVLFNLFDDQMNFSNFQYLKFKKSVRHLKKQATFRFDIPKN